MIIKSKTHRNKGAIKSVLEYITRKEAQYKDKEGRQLFIKHNLLGKKDDINYFTHQFIDNLEHRINHRKDNINLLHDIISFHPESGQFIDVKVLKDIAHKYIQERNPLGIYLITAHGDREHVHLHVASSALEFQSGKSMRMSKDDFSKFQKSIEDYQKKHYPLLDKSIVNYGDKSKKKPGRLEQIGSIRLNKQKE